jgi:hypothetical protein
VWNSHRCAGVLRLETRILDRETSDTMNHTRQQQIGTRDHSGKRILARGCDPLASAEAARAIPPLVGNPTYTATTNDEDFIEKLRTQDWSVVFFAPGACRFSAAHEAIPGGNSRTQGWTLEQYRELVRELQGDRVEIVETPDERDTVRLLGEALDRAPETPRNLPTSS